MVYYSKLLALDEKAPIDSAPTPKNAHVKNQVKSYTTCYPWCKMSILIKIKEAGLKEVADARALINLIIAGKHPFIGLPTTKLSISLLAISVTIIFVELYISNLKAKKIQAADRLAELANQAVGSDAKHAAKVSEIAGDSARVDASAAPTTPSPKTDRSKRGMTAGAGDAPMTPVQSGRGNVNGTSSPSAGSEAGGTPSSTEKKQTKLQVDEFIKQLVSTGLECRKQKVAGQPPTPASERAKCLRMKSDGHLYFYSETFKVRRIWSADEMWQVEELSNAVEGDKEMGEVFLEFVNPHTLKSKIICILIDGTRHRRLVTHQFNDLARCAATSPELLRKTVHDVYYTVSSPSPNKALPTQSPSSNDKHASPGPSTSTSTSPNQQGNNVSFEGGSVGSNIDNLSTASPTATTVNINSNTNFHDWTNREMLSLIKSEGLHKDVASSCERHDLIRVLETHWRTKQGKPLVNVNFSNFQAQLVSIYRRFNPEKIPEIPKMASHFEGQEKYLLETIIAKYNVLETDLHLFGVVLGSQKVRGGRR